MIAGAKPNSNKLIRELCDPCGSIDVGFGSQLQLAGFIGASDFAIPVTTVGGQIRLAEITITVSGANGSSLTLEPATLGGTFAGNIGFDSGLNFDAANVSTSRITITVVPEPHTAALCSLVLGAVIVGRRRRQDHSRFG